MNTLLMLALVTIAPSYEAAPMPCETEEMALKVAQWEMPAATSRWVQAIGGAWETMTNRTESFKRPWRWWFRRTTLRLDGVTADFKVKVNGEAVAESKGVHTLVEFDLTDHLNIFAANTLDFEIAPRADGAKDAFRNVWVVSTSSGSPREIRIETMLSPDFSQATFVARDELGNEIKRRDVPSPVLWSDEQPAVYLTPLEHHYGWWIFGGIEYRAVKFGFTRSEFKNGAVLINGKPARFAAVAAHKSTPGRSARGTRRSKLVWDSGLVKSFNGNAVRAAEYPLCSDWYELCDRDGIYVIAAEGERVPAYHPCVVTLPAAAMPKFSTALDGDHATILGFKQANQPVSAIAYDWKRNAVKVRNDYRFTSLEKLDGIRWTGFDEKGAEVAKGELGHPAVEAGATAELTLEGVKGVRVRFEFVRDEDVVAWNEFKKGR